MKDRMPISPNPRQPSLHDSRFEPINKTPITLSKYRKPIDVRMGKQSDRSVPPTHAGAKFYDTNKESTMHRLNTGLPNYKKMCGHGHPSSVIPVN